MLIAVDARTAFDPQPRGIGKTLISLYRALALQRPDWRFVMLHRDSSGRNPFEGASNISSVHTDFIGDRWNLWERIWLPLTVQAVRPDLMHCPANWAPRRCPVPFVLTMHDIIPMHRPNFSGAQRWFMQTLRAAQTAARVVTPSVFSKTEVIYTLKIRPEKISVVPWAAQVDMTSGNDSKLLSGTLSEYGIPTGKRYVLSFGAGDPRKNTRRLLEAWAKVVPSLKASCHLLLVGVEPEALPIFKSLARQLSIDNDCVINGFAKERDLPVLIGGATALCYVSVSEGFGLPVLDAFACGTPVLASNATSIPEIAGDASLFVDPFSVASIASGLGRLVEDKALRKQLVYKGFEQSKRFSWKRSAELMAAVLEEARSDADAHR